ncbi:hypothetical protein HPU229334_12210 [Helicobacter pullorum]|uniref:Uncharacterized protein n=1 Tax=Helicobacter pullorum TaxID=35818 RepID=A0A0N0LSJ3_9HELI|nr:hypothetical protein HPU229334_12210 [Helicobacter pullorum]
MKNMLKHSKKQKNNTKGNPKYAKKRNAKNKCKSAREALALNMLGGGMKRISPQNSYKLSRINPFVFLRMQGHPNILH